MKVGNYNDVIYSFCVGNISIPNPITYLNPVLTCISTGGPATTVIWTRKSPGDRVTVVNESSQASKLDDSNSGQYTHTLRVSQIDVATVYECFVSNNKPSSAKAAATLSRNGMFCLYNSSGFLDHRSYLQCIHHTPISLTITCHCMYGELVQFT